MKKTARGLLLAVGVLAGIAVFPLSALGQSSGSIAMERLYNPYSGEHFYTGSISEVDDLTALGWRDEGVGWVAPCTSRTPVFRLYNPFVAGGDHHYTTSVGERDSLVAAGWQDEGVGWYSDDEHAVGVFREYNPYAFARNHNFTTSVEEHNSLTRVGWIDESSDGNYSWYGLVQGGHDVPANYSERQALKRAQEYLAYSAFSRDGLVKQLKYEGYSETVAMWGVDHCGADWYVQALKKADSYLEYKAFSYQGLVGQLESAYGEMFTHDQAVYGVDHCGANWNEEAVRCAQEYLRYGTWSRNGLINQLCSSYGEKFTYEQAVYGVDHCGVEWQ